MCQRLGRPIEYLDAFAQADDPVSACLRQRDVVNVDQGGRAALVREFANQTHDLSGCLWIERCSRLIHEQQVGFLHQCARDADALTLAAGQVVGPSVLAAL